MNPIAFIFALIALVGTVVAGVMFGNSLTTSSNQTSTLQVVKQVAMNMQMHYTKQGSFSGATTATEIANGDIPPAMVAPGASVPTTPTGAQLAIAGPASVNGGSNNAIGVNLSGLSQPLCIQLATRISAYGVNQGTTVGTGVNSTDLPATDAQAASLCSQAGSSNSLTWTYLLSSASVSAAASQPASSASSSSQQSSNSSTSSTPAASSPSTQPLDTLGHPLYNLSTSIPSSQYPTWAQACGAICTSNGLTWDQRVTQSGGQVVSCGCTQ